LAVWDGTPVWGFVWGEKWPNISHLVP